MHCVHTPYTIYNLERECERYFVVVPVPLIFLIHFALVSLFFHTRVVPIPSIVIFFNSISFAVDILNGIVDNELYLKIPYAFNTTHRDCVWRDAFKDRKLCTDEVKIWLNSNGYEEMV